MRKAFTTIILIIVFIVGVSTPCHAKRHGVRTNVRYADGLVYCYDANERLAYIQTSDGNLWTCKADCTQLGCVRVKFDTMGTKRVTDDRIIKISLSK